jgi:inorganic pyrophosphatase
MTQGDVVKAKAIGVLRMTDTGKKDDKIIAVYSKSKFYKFNNIDHLNSEHPELLKKIVFWFENYKGKNVVEFIKFGSANEANNLIKSSEKLFKRSGVKPRS